MKIRIQPWLTDSSIIFLNNIFKWYPEYLQKRLTVLEWGGGNSTIYFLQKKCRVLTIENNEDYINDLSAFSKLLGFKSKIVTKLDECLNYYKDNDLTILKASKFDDIGESVFDSEDWSIILNDGISRLEVLNAINQKERSSLLILDNIEYCANWGKLERGSAHPDRVKAYRQILRDSKWKNYIFEQSEGREGHSTADFSGWEAPHRWITAVLWRHNHLFSKLLVSNIGLPLITIDGFDDSDIPSISERCPFDWKEMKWLVDEYKNVFTLKRNFE